MFANRRLTTWLRGHKDYVLRHSYDSTTYLEGTSKARKVMHETDSERRTIIIHRSNSVIHYLAKSRTPSLMTSEGACRVCNYH